MKENKDLLEYLGNIFIFGMQSSKHNNNNNNNNNSTQKMLNLPWYYGILQQESR